MSSIMEPKSMPLQITITREEAEKKRLQEKIIKKREKLIELITRAEMLKVELEMVQQEYDVRVGKLYLTSNSQDLDIIYYRNLLELLRDGMKYEDAVAKLEETYYGQQRNFEKEQEQIRIEEEILKKRSEVESETEHLFDFKDLKTLWKYLVSKFHPDLVLDPKEKKKREEIMKQINQAYEEKNYDALKKLEKEVHIEIYEESTLEKLTEILVDIENEIIHYVEVFRELKKSKWYSWKLKIEKAKSNHEDIFSDIEKALLDEIVMNRTIIEGLKIEVEQYRKKK